jgi:assimilatory nitrate reductase catalytic subunit
MSRTGTIGRSFGHVAEPTIELHPQDLRRLSLNEGDLVHVTSRRGSIVLPVAASDAVAPTQAFVAMHWGEEFVSGSGAQGQRLAGINALTVPAFDPQSKQPELKHCAVKMLKAELPWRFVGAAWLPADRAQSLRAELSAQMAAFAFAVCVPFGHEHSGLLFRAAAYEAPPKAVLERIEELLGLVGPAVLRYEDRRRGQRRAMRLAAEGADSRLDAFVLAGDASAEGWIRALLQERLPAQAFGRALLSPGAKPPAPLAPRGRQVCSCLDVTEAQIVDALSRSAGGAEQRLAQLQRDLKCGTNCGSCVPELKRMVQGASIAA